RINQGPPPATTQQVEDLHYRLSDLLDDLDGATDPDETTVIATAVLTSTAELALTIAGQWLAGGSGSAAACAPPITTCTPRCSPPFAAPQAATRASYEPSPTGSSTGPEDG